jgi:hypothetical protein
METSFINQSKRALALIPVASTRDGSWGFARTQLIRLLDISRRSRSAYAILTSLVMYGRPMGQTAPVLRVNSEHRRHDKRGRRHFSRSTDGSLGRPQSNEKSAQHTMS